ncbi:hypothetical protein ACFLYQ_04950 [Chloroflexota bacterium]
MKVLAIITSILGAALIGALTWGFITTGELNQTRDILSSTISELVTVTTELEEKTNELTITMNELTDARDDLESTEDELTNTRNNLERTRDELLVAASELSSTKKSLTNTENDLTDTQEQLDIAQGTLEGLGIDLMSSKQCFDVDLVDNPLATNPTWEQLTDFLYEDMTETNTYIEHVYDCSEFSRDIHNNAEAAGIRAAEVQIRWADDSIGHALNAFLTTDYGLVYVDCTGGPDTAARIKVGKVYRSVEVNRITAYNVRDDNWWDNLDIYFYIETNYGGESETAAIRIFW